MLGTVLTLGTYNVLCSSGERDCGPVTPRLAGWCWWSCFVVIGGGSESVGGVDYSTVVMQQSKTKKTKDRQVKLK